MLNYAIFRHTLIRIVNIFFVNNSFEEIAFTYLVAATALASQAFRFRGAFPLTRAPSLFGSQRPRNQNACFRSLAARPACHEIHGEPFLLIS